MKNELPTSDPVSMKRRGSPPLPEAEYHRRWMERLMKRTVFNDKGCFVWQGPVTPKGYISHAHRDWRTQGHRIVYMLTHGVRLETKAFVCHSCDERRCWNPGHLFVGSAKANNNDCADKGRHHNSVKTHCKYGHEYTPENTSLRTLPTGSIARTCLTCEEMRMRSERYVNWRREYQRRRRAEKRAAAQAESR